MSESESQLRSEFLSSAAREQHGPLLGRIRATFLSPGRLTELLAPGQPWLDVLLISTAVAIVAVAAAPDDVFLNAMREPVTRRGVPVEVTSSPDVIARWGRGMGMLSTLAAHPAIALCLAAGLTAIFTLYFRGPAGFREHLALVSHALLIPALGTAITLLLRPLIGDIGPAAMSSGDPDALRLVLSFDPFVIWMLIVIGYGIHALDPRRSRLRTSTLLIVLYLILTAAGTLILDRVRAPGSNVAAATDVSRSTPPWSALSSST